MNIKDLLETAESPEKKIALLKEKDIVTGNWNTLRDKYDPKRHPIVTNPSLRPKDKEKNGQVEKVSKITYAAEQISVRRMNQMLFTIPVKRKYHYDVNDETLKQIAAAKEAIYEKVRINGVNANRFRAYYGACEVATVWFSKTEEAEHNEYGFSTKLKLRCRSYSPMDTKFSKVSQANIYPIFDEYDDLMALSFEYTRKEKGKDVGYFDCYTADTTYQFKTIEGKTEVEETPNPIKKIPVVYWYSPMAIYEGIENNRSEIEFALSRNSDIIRKNAAPIIVLKGALANAKDKPVSDVSTKIFHFTDGTGDASTISPAVTSDNTKFLVSEMRKNIEEETQLPNLSMENVKGLGVVSGEARKTLLTDAHMKAGEEAPDIIWGFERESKVIDAFLALMNVSWKDKLPLIKTEHIITPFIPNDETVKSNRLATEFNAGIKSRKTAITDLGDVQDAEAELAQIQAEESAVTENNAKQDIFPNYE